MKLSKDTTKPLHSIMSNINYFFELQWSLGKSSYFLLLFLIPITVGLSFCKVYMPKLVVMELLNYNDINHIISAIIFFGLIIALLNIVKTIIETLNYAYLMKYIRSVMLKKNRKNFETNYENTESSEYRHLLQRADESLWAMGSDCAVTKFPKYIGELITNLLQIIVFGSIVISINPLLAIILIFTPFIHFFVVKSIQKQQNQINKHTETLDRKQWYIANNSGSFKSGKDIRIYGLKDWFIEMFKRLTSERLKWDRYFAFKYIIASLLDVGIILLRDGLAYIILIHMVLGNKISIDNFVLCFSIIASFASMLGEVLNKTIEINSISLLLSDLRDFFDFPDKINENSRQLENIKFTYPLTIEVIDLHYSFVESQNDIISSVNFVIKPGEKIAIVGLNGAGKTTLIKNLCGLYMPTKGTIKINGKDSKDFKPDEYFSLFSVVFQDFYFLPESIAANVACNSSEYIDRKKVIESLNLAGLTEKVNSLKDGIDTLINKQVNSNGVELSGGEEQKLLLARAIYKDAPILILDEPTSALDPIAEKELYEKYSELTKNKTSIFISHRLSSTQFCDRILFLEDGKIVENGSHSYLMKLNGKYAELYNVQSQYYKQKDK